MKLDYGTQLSPYPIKLSIGTLIKPKLKDIAELSFEKFSYYEVLIKMTPEFYYTKIMGDKGAEYWEQLSEEEQKNISLYTIVINDKNMIDNFTEIFNFFFDENVIFRDKYFVLLNKNLDMTDDNIQENDIKGIISESTFSQVLNIIQQVCCIGNNDESVEDIKFKNETARKMYEKMQKAAKKQKEQRKANLDFSLPNIISKVSNKHPTISPFNVWDLTIFQLLEAFNFIQNEVIFEIESTRVAVWGDEKKTFKASNWYKNEYDKKTN